MCTPIYVFFLLTSSKLAMGQVTSFSKDSSGLYSIDVKNTSNNNTIFSNTYRMEVGKAFDVNTLLYAALYVDPNTQQPKYYFVPKSDFDNKLDRELFLRRSFFFDKLADNNTKYSDKSIGNDSFLIDEYGNRIKEYDDVMSGKINIDAYCMKMDPCYGAFKCCNNSPSTIPSPSVGVVPNIIPSPAPSPSVGVVPNIIPSPAPSPSIGVVPNIIPSPAPSPSIGVVPSPAPSPSLGVVPSPAPSPSMSVVPNIPPSPAPRSSLGSIPSRTTDVWLYVVSSTTFVVAVATYVFLKEK